MSLLILLTSCATQTAETDLFSTGSDAEAQLAAEMGMEVLASMEAKTLVPVGNLEVRRIVLDELGMAHTHAFQTYNGILVEGGEAIVHLNPDGTPASLTNALIPDVSVSTVPDWTENEGVDLAVEAMGGWQRITDDPMATLVIVRDDGVDRLAWKVRMEKMDENPSIPVAYIDAHSGELIRSYENLQTSSGTAYFAGSVSINSYYSGGTYYLEDTVRHMGTYTWSNGTRTMSKISDSDDNWTSDSTAVQAHYAAAKVYDYYLNVHGRNGLDGAGGPGYVSSLTGSGKTIASTVHYSRNYANAFWNGSYMTYGDGDGVYFYPLVSQDIAGHEMTHGVIERTANLTYSGESGGLNEAIADIFGAMTERYADGSVSSSDTWQIGEDAYIPAGALRYMNAPANDGVSLDYYTSTAGSADVHYSSGIANLAFYLLSEGGAHPRLGGTAVTGVGADAAASIWYRALTVYMTSSTNFAGARTATLSAASDLYGATSSQYTSVGAAWDAVGVTSSGSGGGGGSATTCTGANYTNNAGSLSGSGKSAYEPTAGSFSLTSSKSLTGTLYGASGTDYDLYLQKYSKSKWSSVASGTTSTSTESVTYNASSGTYRWVVYSYSGSGSYSFCY